MLEVVIVWLVGSALWHGVHRGGYWEADESPKFSKSPYHEAFVWPVYPIYWVGFQLGVWLKRRELAPKRMQEKLMEANKQPPQGQYPFPGIITGPSVGAGGTSGSTTISPHSTTGTAWTPWTP